MRLGRKYAGLAGFLVSTCVLMVACVATPPLPDEAMSEGQKNLAAIREALSQVPHRFMHPGTEARDRTDPSATGIHDAPARFPAPVSPSARSSAPSRYPQDFRVTIPWKPTPVVPADEPFRPVAPYINPLPAGAMYGGSVRCVPDFSGGQRCHGN